jgi:branched-chain amino acid transport system permease protein
MVRLVTEDQPDVVALQVTIAADESVTGTISHNGTVAFLPELPIIPAMLVAALMCVPIGFLAGYPALRRRGLFLALTTLAVSLVLERLVFQNFFFISGPEATNLARPTLLGLDLSSDMAFYYFGLAVVGLMILLTVNLRSGRLGRILGAMRDSENGAQSVGVSLRKYKLFIFSASAFMAGLGGETIPL